jgi:hypothetical protein
MSKAAKILILVNGLLATAALNPVVQSAVGGFVGHHPFLTVLGTALSSVVHLLTDARKSN